MMEGVIISSRETKKRKRTKKPLVNLLDENEAKALLKFWIKQNEFKETGNDEMNAYYNGVAAGTEFALWVMERTGD